MTRILVVPESLRLLSAQLQHAAGDLRAVEGRVGSALGGLAWEARQKAGVDGQANHARSQARALAAQAEDMSRYLAAKAQAFEDADGQGVSSVGQISASFNQWLQGSQAWWRFPSQQANAWGNLGGLFGQPSQIQALRLPVAGGAAVVGLASLTSLSETLSKVQGFGERVWNWLRRKGWKTDEDLAAADQGPGAPKTSEGGFGELIAEARKSEEEEKPDQQSPPESKPEVAPETKPDPPVQPTQPAKGEWWKEVPLQSQQGLTYKGEKTAYGCTPTATSMILDHWHAQDPANKTMSAQELLDINAGQKVFHSKGMSATNILDEVSGLGYGVTDVHADSNLDTLKEAVSKGPALAIVKLGMKATGTNHAVVVTGVSDDGQQVRINDPWTGQTHTYSWNEFSKSWGANFGKDAPKNNFVAIRPS
ncbi:MAG: C39 family peptidase [Chloroflexota bacterium]|nr:C39 family peptidase [Chloroflexota bacterium]